MNQCVAHFNTHYFDSREKRSTVKLEEVVSPLDMLFEFGELDSAFPVDPLLKPVVYLGNKFSAIGHPHNKWRNDVIGNNLSCVIEASEPSTGMRYICAILRHSN
jgi:hypothetical protein